MYHLLNNNRFGKGGPKHNGYSKNQNQIKPPYSLFTSLFGNKPSTNLNLKSRKELPLIPEKRVYLTSDELQFLEICFFTKYEPDIVDQRQWKNLALFLSEVEQKKDLLIVAVGEGRTEYILGEIQKLSHSQAVNQLIEWQKARELIESRTNLNFPITPAYRSEKEAYASLLFKKGNQEAANEKSLYLDSLKLPNSSYVKPDVRSHSNLVELSAVLNQKYVNYIPPCDMLVSERIENYMKPGNLIDEVNVMDVVADDEDDDDNVAVANQEELLAMRYVPLTDVENNEVDNILDGPNNLDLVIEKFNIPMNRNKMLCLRPSTWLNDEVNRIISHCVFFTLFQK